MPSWEQLQPARMAPQLTVLWAYRYDPASGQFTGRLLGNRLMHAVAGRFQGMSLQQVHPITAAFDWVNKAMTRVVSEPAAFHSGGKLFRHAGRIIEGERIMLPLGSDGIHGDGVLGASDYHYPQPDFAQDTWEALLDIEDWASLQG